MLELAVLGGVDQRVDAAVDLEHHHCQLVEHNHKSQLVEPAADVDAVSEEVNEHEDLVGRPTHNESTADHHRNDHCVPPCRAECRVVRDGRLQ